MALKQSDGILLKKGATPKFPPAVLYKKDLEEQLRRPEVRMRMERVEALVERRAQQKS